MGRCQNCEVLYIKEFKPEANYQECCDNDCLSAYTGIECYYEF